ncbi:MAG: hypothetical protein GY711_00145 [bacterium]|nr:hypothetical protein [bacterium]
MHRFTGPSILFLLASSAPAFAQLHSVTGDLAQDRFGESVDGAGDVNNDGFEDFLVGSRHDFNVFCTGIDVSYLRVFCGQTGDVLYNHPDDGDDHRGALVRGLGDLDGDGYDDYGDANAPDFCCAFTTPSARVYSGHTGTLLHTFPTSWWDLFDRAMEAAGDPNSDGFDDVILGEADYGPAGSGTREGRVSLYAGNTGALLLQIIGSAPGEHAGHSVAGVGDWDGDLRDDVAYSSGPTWSSPYIRVVNVLGNVLFTLPVAGEVQDAGDFDGDLARDLFVVTGSTARVYSGADASVLLDLSGWTRYRVVDDVDGDGTADFLVSSPGLGPGGVVAVLDGSTGDEMIRLREGAAGDSAGFSIGAAGDVSGDGRNDFLLGAIDETGDRGAAHVYASPSPPVPANYCPGLSNSVGPGAALGIAGTWSLANAELRLVSSACPPNQFGIMFYGRTATGGSPVGEGLLCVGLPFYRLLPAVSTGTAGAGQYDVDFSAPPVDSGPGRIEAGSTYHFQFWYRDPVGGPVGYNFSEGLSITFSL